MSLESPHVFIVDDDGSCLKSLARLLRASGFSVKAFSSAEEFLAHRPSDSSGCLVTDLQMPGMSGMELQNQMAKAENPLPVIFLTAHCNTSTIVEAMRRGAEDFLAKSSDKELLLAAVRRALSRNARERHEQALRRDLLARFETLTPREREVVTHVCDGQLNKQIAATLQIDERSVKRHRTNLMAKLCICSVAELVQLVHEAGWASRR